MGSNMRTELAQTFISAVSEVKHLLDFGPIAARRDRRALYQLEQTKIGEYIVSGDMYLDVGCGKGYIRRHLEQLKPNVRVFGCDIDDKPTKRMKLATSQTFTTADGSSLPFPDRSFDGAMIFFVFHHTPHEIQERILLESIRVVRNGGYIFIAEDTVSKNDAKQWEVTLRADRKFNPEFGLKRPHDYRSSEEWKDLFFTNDLKLLNEISYYSGEVPHTFFVLQRN